MQDNGREERAAVIWWLGTEQPHLNPADAERRFNEILERRGTELQAILADHKAHLVQVGRLNGDIPTPEEPAPMPVKPKERAIEMGRPQRPVRSSATSPQAPPTTVTATRGENTLQRLARQNAAEAKVLEALMMIDDDLHVSVLRQLLNAITEGSGREPTNQHA